ncbi:MAG: hypothetical protein OXU73_00295 [Candidatus Campbellbacteria bacterium]|nr:hypothetical protein [Candidatus Campbellbacteria bacterium]
MKMNFNELSKFQKEFKTLAKKYKSLPKDLQEFCKVVSVDPIGNSKHFNVITQTETFYIIKARFFCKYLKRNSFRIIYSYFEAEQKIEFIEIYFKGNKEKEDKERIKEYTKEKPKR